MGNGLPVGKKAPVIQMIRHEFDQADDRMHSYLAQLPKLFVETQVGNNLFLATMHVAEDFQSVTFAAHSSQMGLFSKSLTEEELKEIRDVTDQQHQYGWYEFFTSIKNAFFGKKVVLKFEEKQMVIRIELLFSDNQKRALTLALKKKDESWKEINDVFLQPMYGFYKLRTEIIPQSRMEKIDSEIETIRQKVEALEGKKRRGEFIDVIEEEKTENGTNEANADGSKSPQDVSYFDVPADKMVKFLKEMKKKLISLQQLTEEEQESFNSVLNTLSQDDLFAPSVKTDIPEVDKTVVSYLRDRFSIKADPNSDKQKKNEIKTANSAEDLFHMNPNIERKNTKDDIMAMFDRVDDYNFDVFTLDKLTSGQTLFVTAITLFYKYDLVNKYNIEEKVLHSFLTRVQEGYRPNPYHSAMHAADVLQIVHYIILQGGLSQYLNNDDIFAALVSAACHDYDHPGLNNTFQMNAQSYLATIYNDRSVLENHHCAQTFEIMRNKKYNILGSVTDKQRRDIRETICQMILSTDMAIHAQVVGKFKSRIEAEVDFSSREDVRLALQVAIKMADVSNPSRPLKIYIQWTKQICKEFYSQGDKEKELGLPVSPLMDRTQQNVGKGQIAFMNFLVTPMFASFAIFLKKMGFASDFIKANKEFWEKYPTVDENELAARVDAVMKDEIS